MRKFNLKGEWLIPNAENAEPAPARTLYPEPLRVAEPGWIQRNWVPGDAEVRPEGDLEDDELRAAREWLIHLQAGRLGSANR